MSTVVAAIAEAEIAEAEVATTIGLGLGANSSGCDMFLRCVGVDIMTALLGIILEGCSSSASGMLRVEECSASSAVELVRGM